MRSHAKDHFSRTAEPGTFEFMPNIGAGRPPELEGDDPDFPEIALVRDVLTIPSPGHMADPDEWMQTGPSTARSISATA